MLDQDTKRRIDTARDILVGKLPNPQAQVEQITIAMIYKFMDDMDKEAMEFGGEATFFTGEFEKYSWTKIFDPKLGGFEMLALYGEAIVKLNQNPSIPQLFRDIFKNAFLPYRDPETLKMFLKIINEFHYDHSEKLGDAFEYLLSVLGSQGDAGQFRTPRHIIDFMVAIMQPKKEESICDPACGTAGFLISSYKHILSENTKKNKGDLLTPDDRKKLINNFVGYDISAEMVRLSLVNLYLHGFTTPKIFEYDTLTSEDRWGDYFDIILANPPFMTPKGGIRPHKKFAMQANRSEVLFVDYIMEHINPTTGRAAIIVPEGIIFQSATAYKALRKLLVDKNFLYGVVSLPAGIFQPYSGVKTSILLLDKSLAKKTEKVLFVKIENDGFALGSQRKELLTSDLPDAINLINQYNTAIRNDDFTTLDLDNLPLNSLVIDKSEITENADYNLNADRYRILKHNHNTKFDFVALSDLCELVRGVTYSKEDEVDTDGLKILRANNIKLDSGEIDFSDVKMISKEVKLSDKQKLKSKDIFICTASGSADHIGKTAFVENDIDYYFGGFMGAIRCNEKILPEYLFQNLRGERFNTHLNNIIAGANIKNLKAEFLYSFQIPLPPISYQQEIVSKINQYDKIVNGAKQVIENYKPQIDVNAEWQLIELGTLATFVQGINTAIDKLNYVESGIKVLQANNIYLGTVNYDNLKFITQEEYDEINTKYKPTLEDVLYSNIGARFGYASILENDEPCTFSWNVLRLILKDTSIINKYYLKHILNTDYIRNIVLSKSSTSTMPFISGKELKQVLIPVPSLIEQEDIIKSIQVEQVHINSSSELIKIFNQKVKSEITKLWAE
jgi:type I restriction enzyme M protein